MRIHNCPVCNATAFSNTLVCKDYTVSKEDFQLVICNICGFKFTNPRPDNDVLGNFYKSEEYISHSDTRKGIVAKLYHFVRNYTLKNKIKLISRYVSRGTLLDYGSGTGMFLGACSKAGWKVIGIEPDNDARNVAKKSRLEVHSDKRALALPDSSGFFDAITLWHVLEHVTDLDETLLFFKQSLKKDGVLIVAVPNHKSFDAQMYKQFWAAYDVPRHLYHFDIDSVSQLLGKFDFELANTHPMKFDSFYVSMLSEKYKTGSVRYLMAFLNGLKSNWKALSTKEYSSRIYVFKHKK